MDDSTTESVDAPMPGLAPPTTHVSVCTLQRNLQRMFHEQPAHRAVAQALAEVGDFMDGIYLTLNARLGDRMISEEWSWDGFDALEAMQELAGDSMRSAMSEEKPRCVRIGEMPELAPAVIAAPIYDQRSELAGAAAVVVGPCDREKARDVLALFEGVMGYLALLASGGITALQSEGESENQDLIIPAQAQAAAHHPMFLAHAMAAQLKNQNPLQQVFVGFVRGANCRIAAAVGMEEIRSSNPGVKLVQSAMRECLDVAKPVLCSGVDLADEEAQGVVEDDFRMHSQWSRQIGGDAVASFPLSSGDRIVAIISVRADAATGLQHGQLAQFGKEMAPYASLVGTASKAGRSLSVHVADAARQRLAGFYGENRWKAWSMASVAAVLLIWFLFGTMNYSIVVPATVTAADPFVVAAPREGVLREVLVQPGDRVKAGAVLARLDTQDERLRVVELQAELRRVEVLADQARATGEPAQAKVHVTEVAAFRAQLAQARLRIERSEIRAARAGVILDGDLRKRVGARLSLGEPLFELGSDGHVLVRLQIPERHVWDGREATEVVFSPTARPDAKIRLQGMRVAPASSTDAGQNVFAAECVAVAAPDHLSPGMEGASHLQVGERRVWWVLTHRITDWLYLSGWL